MKKLSLLLCALLMTGVVMAGDGDKKGNCKKGEKKECCKKDEKKACCKKGDKKDCHKDEKKAEKK
ncbi:MAG: hypothetical protein H6551_01935 [Chitinophagales bacterium]|nr:hypothetical protein [Chitinophagaceae bacterium]MCB9063883.1 hypothetical protein [Chitinophagales bacterium]